MTPYPAWIRIPLAPVLGGAVFAVGLFRLMLCTARFTVRVWSGEHPAEAVARMPERLWRSGRSKASDGRFS